MDNWKNMIKREMADHGEDFDDTVSCTITENELLQKFDDGFGSVEGVPFTLWTAKRVYFPASYDGAEWVASVSRNPDATPTFHVGGG